MKILCLILIIFVGFNFALKAQKLAIKLNHINYNSIHPFLCLNLPAGYKIKTHTEITYKDSGLFTLIYDGILPFDEYFFSLFLSKGQVSTIQDIVIQKPDNNYDLLKKKINIYYEDSTIVFDCQNVEDIISNNSIDKKGRYHGDWVHNYTDTRNSCKYQKVGKYKNGRLIGEWTERNSCGYKKVSNFDSIGFIIKETEFYTSGNVKKITHMKNRMESGPYREFYENGKLKVEGNYNIDCQDTSYIDTKTIDYSIESTIINISPVKDGIWIYYSEKGNIMLKEYFNKGKLIKREVY